MQPTTDLPSLIAAWRADPASPIRVAAYGSSNTELWWHNQGRFSWVCWLATSFRARVGKHVSTTNLGICGDTTPGLVGRAGRDLWPLNPHAVIVTIGGNDQWQVDPRQYIRSLRGLVDQIIAHDALPILRTYYSMLMEDMPGVDPEHFTPYMQGAVALAREMGLPCIDIYAMLHPWHLRAPEQYRRIMLDPAHLNALGHALVGTLTVRAFGLPDPPMPEDYAAPVADLLRQVTGTA